MHTVHTSCSRASAPSFLASSQGLFWSTLVHLVGQRHHLAQRAGVVAAVVERMDLAGRIAQREQQRVAVGRHLAQLAAEALADEATPRGWRC
jgi:ABC-type phosphate/phosphonate transport system ATPase subunit